MNEQPGQLCLLLIPGVATWLAVVTLQGGRAMERHSTKSCVRWLSASAIVLNTLGIIGVAATLLVGQITLFILLPGLSLLLTVWMMRRRRAQLRFAWGLLIAKRDGLPPEPLARAISETSPWWTRRQLRSAVDAIKLGSTSLGAIQKARISVPIEVGLALSEKNTGSFDSDKLLLRFESLSAIRHSYREFIRLWNYFATVAILLLLFLAFICPTLDRLMIEVEANNYLTFPMPTQLLASYGLSRSALLVISNLTSLVIFAFSVVLNLDQLELWPWNWWPSSRLHRRWFQCVTLEHACREAAGGRTWTSIFQSLAEEHPVRRIRKQAKSICQSVDDGRAATALRRYGWISKAVEEQIRLGDVCAESEIKILVNAFQREYEAISSGWNNMTKTLRWLGTVSAGFFVGWTAFVLFDSLSQAIQRIS
jgi:hypothetical protein